jgi:hypothetical protein
MRQWPDTALLDRLICQGFKRPAAGAASIVYDTVDDFGAINDAHKGKW